MAAEKQYGKRIIALYILLFMTVILVYTSVMIVRGVYPFGDKSFLFQDAYDQYTGIMQLFLEWIHGDSGTFLWSNGMGEDMLLNIFYYCMSPFNIIAFLLGADRIELSMTIIIILKTACLAPAAFYFFKNSNINRLVDEKISRGFVTGVSFVCALAYSLSGFILSYNHNVIWLDSLILLPFIAIAVEKLAKGEGHISYVLLLAATFIINFYFAFFVALFIVLYFILQEWDSAKDFFKGLGRFLLMSVIAAAIAGVVLLPSLYAIMNLSSSGNDDYSTAWNTMDNLWTFMTSFYPFDELSTSYLFSHNNYCGTIILLLVILFLMLPKVKKTFRLKYFLVVAFLVAGLNLAGLNYILHGFTITHGMGNRFAFILLFLVLIMGYISLLNVRNYNIKKILPAASFVIAAYALEILFNSEKASAYSYLMFIFLLVAYILLFIFEARGSIKLKSFYIWVICLWTVELIVNAVYTIPDKINDERIGEAVLEEEWAEEYEELFTEDGERKTALVNRSYLKYSDTNWYSSFVSGYTIDAFESLGLSHYQNIEYTYRGTTPVTSLLFNVRYVVTNETNVLGGYHILSENDDIIFYEADELNGLGFVMNKAVENWTGNDGAAENQNSLVKLATGNAVTDDIFEKIDISDAEISWNGMDIIENEGNTYTYEVDNDVSAVLIISFTASEDMDIYIECADTKIQKVYATIDGVNMVSTEYPESSSLVHIGEACEGEKVKISLFSYAERGDEGIKSFELYSFNEEVFDDFASNIVGNQLELDSFAGNTMNAHITSDTDGVLFFAYTYNDGFSVYVDGEECEALKLGTGLMGVEITAGPHDIVLEYNTPLLDFGIIVSVCGICALLILIIYLKKKHKIQTNE